MAFSKSISHFSENTYFKMADYTAEGYLLPDITPDLHLSEERVVLCEPGPGYVALTRLELELTVLPAGLELVMILLGL